MKSMKDLLICTVYPFVCKILVYQKCKFVRMDAINLLVVCYKGNIWADRKLPVNISCGNLLL